MSLDQNPMRPAGSSRVEQMKAAADAMKERSRALAEMSAIVADTVKAHVGTVNVKEAGNLVAKDAQPFNPDAPILAAVEANHSFIMEGSKSLREGLAKKGDHYAEDYKNHMAQRQLDEYADNVLAAINPNAPAPQPAPVAAQPAPQAAPAPAPAAAPAAGGDDEDLGADF